MRGKLIKGVGGLYSVYCDGQIYQTKARGRFRKDKLKPIIGDNVQFVPAAGGEDFGAIDEIETRKNSFIRPPVANIDLMLVVMAAASPEPDLLLADKLLLETRIKNVETVVVINKCDLCDQENIARQYRLSGYRVVMTSAKEGIGLEELKDAMMGKTVAYAGQSGVGKSSLLNAVADLQLETGNVSRIQRGKHTTRHVELISFGKDTWLADTPGFSLYENDMIDPQELKNFYHEFLPYDGKCRFLGCNHISEPGCAVKEAVQNGLIAEERMERYALIYDELKEKWSKRYD